MINWGEQYGIIFLVSESKSTGRALLIMGRGDLMSAGSKVKILRRRGDSRSCLR